jgi:hypothetical protein
LDNNEPSSWHRMGGNFFNNFALRFRLTLRLLRDHRVSLWLKIIPIFSLIYLILPFDLPGPIDDALVVYIDMELFIELCPRSIVDEISREIRGEITNPKEKNPQDIVDADFTEIKEK